MSRTNYQKDRERAAAQFDSELRRRVQSLRSELYREVAAYLSSSIRAGADGRVRLTIGNVRAVNGVSAVVARFAQERGRRLLTWLVRRLSDLFGLNRSYFRSFLEYPASRDERALRLLLLRLGYDTSTGRTAAGGFLERVFRLDGVAAQVARDIQQALAAKQTLAAFRQAFRARFLAAGYVERWFNQFTRDMFHQFDAAAQTVMAEELGLDHFMYAGTLITTSRCFCERRVNRIYTREFAGRWNEQAWRGKIPNGDFFLDRGGYNCRHHLSFITRSLAERQARQRGIEINSFNDQFQCDEAKE